MFQQLKACTALTEDLVMPCLVDVSEGSPLFWGETRGVEGRDAVVGMHCMGEE